MHPIIARFTRPSTPRCSTVALHSCSPYTASRRSTKGTIRNVELSVLYDDQEEHAFALGAALARELPNVAYNGAMVGQGRPDLLGGDPLAQEIYRVALEIEVRQDLAVDPTYRARLIPVLAEHIAKTFVVR